MNKAFKVIWNHATQSWTAVSEIARAKGKTKSVKTAKTAVAVAVTAGSAMMSSQAMAAAVADTPISISGNDIYIATDAAGNTAFGKNAYATNPANTDATLSLAIGANANASGNATTAIGRGSVATGNWSMAIGSDATATGGNDIAIGEQAKSSAAYAVAIGKGANATGGQALAMGYNSTANNSLAMALGVNSLATGVGSFAGSAESKALKDYAVAIGASAEANATEGSVAVGWSAGVADGATSGLALGGAAKVNGVRGVAIGRSVHANGTYSVAVGTGTAVRGEGSSTVGYSNVIGSTSSDASAFGSKNLIGATATFASNGITQSASIADTAAVTNSKVVGNNNYISSSNTYVLGSGVGVKDDGTSFMDTVENSVYLGNDSTITSSTATIDATTAGTVKNLNTNGDAGATSTAGSKGTVTEANVSGLVYGDFAGATSVGAVSVGASGSERRIVNMAAGEISATSTDAINGSQLYAVADKLGGQVFNSTYFHVNNATQTQGAGNATTNLGNITDKAGATGDYAVTAGVNSTAVSNSTIAMGHGANAGISRPGVTGEMPTGDHAIAIGTNADAQSADTIAIGRNARVLFTEKETNVFAIPLKSIAIGADSKSQSEYSTAIGFEAIAGDDYHQSNATSVGARAKAVNINTLAVGSNANASGTGSSALGVSSEASSNRATAVGFQSQATGDFGVALGAQADAAYLATATGTGAQATAERATANGYRAESTATNATSLGFKAVASHEKAVALGSGSTTTTANPTTNGTVAGITYGDFAGTTPTSVVSVGSAGAERQIVNVAAGRISATSTDAINGSQLYLVTKGTMDQFPVIYTDTDGNKLVKAPDGNFYPADTVLIDGKYYPPGTTPEQVADGTATPATPVDAGDVIASMNDGDNVADSPKTLANVKGNLTPTYNVGDMTIDATTGVPSDVASTEYTKSQTGPTAEEAAKMYNNAATVGDVLNAGWNLQENGTAKDFVKPYDTVNFINGNGTTVTVTPNADGTASEIKVDINLTDPNLTTTVGDTKLEDGKDGKDGKIDAPTTGGDKLVNATTVADAINDSGFTLKTSAVSGEGEKDPASTGEEIINPGDTVEMVAGKNLQVKQEADGKITYSTKDDVSFNSVQIGDTSTTGAPVVNMTAEKAIPATNNPAGSEPTTALNITSADGKPSQITGVGSVLNVDTVNTNPAGTPATDKLVNLGSPDAPLADNVLNSAATVRDLTNMGWIVEASDNGYVDTVKNANRVDFVSTSDALTVTGETVDGVRTISVGLDKANLTSSILTTDLTNNNGAVQDPTEGDKLVNATTVADAINGSGWTTEATNATTGAKETVVVNPGDAVNYESGNGTIASTTVVKDPVTGKDTVVVKYDIDNGVITPNADGSVTGPAVDEKAKLAEVEKALAAIKNDATATPAQIAEAQKAVDAAKANVATAENKVATAQNVADAINGSGFRVSVNEGENTTVVNPSEQVDFDNTDGNIAITKTTDEVSHNITVNLAKDITVDSVTAGSMNVTSSLPTDTIVVGGPTIGDNTQPKTTDTLLNVTKAAEETPDAVVTAKDLANYGWIAATPNNGYDAAVKSQNTVNFIGDDGIAVTGKANATTGTYDIVVGLADAGKIVKEYTSDKNGAQPTETGRVETAGSNPGGFVSANTVADAINGSGWTTEATNATTGAKETVVVNPGDAVNYADGKGTVANTTVVKDPATGKDTVVVSFDIDNGTITPNEDGSVSGPVTPALTEALKAAEEAQKALPADATPEQVAAAEQAVKDAQDAITNAGNQVATAQNVADAINGSGFRVSVNKGENTTVVNPSEQVNFDNTDKNIVISKTTDEVNHNVTVNLAKDITVNSVNITTANPVVDADGNPVLDNAGNPVTENLSTPLTTIKGSSLDVDGKAPQPADQNPTTGVGTGNALSVGGNQITHVANGAINADSTDAINGAQLYALEERISQGLVVKTTAGENGEVGANNGPAAGVGGKTLEFEAGKNVVLTQTNTETGTKLNIAVSEDPTFNTTTIAGKDGKDGITLTATNGEGKIGINGKDGTSTTLTTVPGGNYNSAGQKIDDTVVPALSVGGNQITHVANGAISPSSTDAINGSQLYALQSNINNQLGDVHNRIGDLDANRKAGSASAMAAAGLPQAYREGQSGIVAALGQYEGETGVAVGFTSISDNGKWLFRGSYATNSQNENAGNLGIGYYW